MAAVQVDRLLGCRCTFHFHTVRPVSVCLEGAVPDLLHDAETELEEGLLDVGRVAGGGFDEVETFTEGEVFGFFGGHFSLGRQVALVADEQEAEV